MDIRRALTDLGIRDETLGDEEKQSLDRDGFIHLRQILSPQQLEVIRARQAELLANEGPRAGAETYTEPGADCLANLINKGREFHIVLTQARVLAGVARVLDFDLKLSSLNSRNALPGKGQQHLHADWDGPMHSGKFLVCNSIWLLDDFTPDNGATRAVPGSHLFPNRPQDVMPDPGAAHPDEILLLGNAGDVFVFNAHTWHGGTLNRTNKPRRALHGYFSRRYVEAQLDQQKVLTRETWHQLSPPARIVLGVIGS